jgi:hypothetical protein
MRAAGSADDWARLAPISNTATNAATQAAPTVSVKDIALPLEFFVADERLRLDGASALRAPSLYAG